MQQVIALDVGGSSIKSGIVATNQHITHHQKTALDTSADADTIFGTMAHIIQTHLAQVDTDNLLGVGFGFPSPFDYDKGISLIHGLEKYEGIYNMNVGDALRDRLNMPALKIKFRNDAEAAIVGEAIYGAGKSYSRLIGVTLGTGLGSGFVANGVRITEIDGVPKHGMLFPLEYKGVRVDDLFSTRGLMQRFTNADIAVDDVKTATILAQSGREDIRAMFASFGYDLGDFLKPYAQTFKAEALLVLGGISGAFDYFGNALSSQIGIPVHHGALKGDAALLGAAQPLFSQ